MAYNLYEVTVPSNETIQYTATNMLSEKHNTNSINYWLSEWLKSGASKPDIVVTDMSLALLSGVIKAFTQYNSLSDYLEQCYKILIKNKCQGLFTENICTLWCCTLYESCIKMEIFARANQ